MKLKCFFCVEDIERKGIYCPICGGNLIEDLIARNVFWLGVILGAISGIMIAWQFGFSSGALVVFAAVVGAIGGVVVGTCLVYRWAQWRFTQRMRITGARSEDDSMTRDNDAEEEA